MAYTELSECIAPGMSMGSEKSRSKEKKEVTPQFYNNKFVCLSHAKDEQKKASRKFCKKTKLRAAKFLSKRSEVESKAFIFLIVILKARQIQKKKETRTISLV